jgi:hypothetical protein
VLSGFDDEDFDIGILSKTACDYTTRGSSTANGELGPASGILAGILTHR